MAGSWGSRTRRRGRPPGAGGPVATGPRDRRRRDRRPGRDHVPRALLDLRLELTRVPAGVAGEQAGPDDRPGQRGRVRRPGPPSPPVVRRRPAGATRSGVRRSLVGRAAGGQPDQPDQCVAGHRAPGEQLGRRRWPTACHCGQQLPDRHPARSVEDHPERAVIAVVEDQHHPAGEVGVGQAGCGHQQMAGQPLGGPAAAVGLEGAERFDRHRPDDGPTGPEWRRRRRSVRLGPWHSSPSNRSAPTSG